MTDRWIFGYGSLIWRADFPYVEQRPAYITNWQRRFWQGSTDHRGVPDKPGRVVTLVAAPGHTCWGMAYRLAEESRESVLTHLDYRERGGYERLALPVFLRDEQPVDGLTWYATENNPNYLGCASPPAIAEQILTARGPSGPNIEYLFRLEQSLLNMDTHDSHVTEIADCLRAMNH